MKEIPLTQGQVALVDDEDYEWLSNRKWCVATKRVYAMGRDVEEKKNIYMHQLIFKHYGIEIPEGMEIDHKNGNNLDNQKSNLRPGTRSQNNMNSRSRENSTSKYKGVSWASHAKKWRAQLQINKKHCHLGYFETEKDAAIAYNEAALKYFGEFAKLNEMIGGN